MNMMRGTPEASAASERHTSQPTVSKSIKEFERAAGMLLFERRSHGTFPTEGGLTPERDIVWEYINPFVVSMAEIQDIAGSHPVFRAYRYAADSPEIRGRVF